MGERDTPNKQPTLSPRSSAKGGVASEEEKGRMPVTWRRRTSPPPRSGPGIRGSAAAATKKALVAEAKPVAKEAVPKKAAPKKAAPKKAALKKPTVKLGRKKAAS